MLVSRIAYNARGEAFETVDPAGQVNRTYADDAGRTVRMIRNYVPPANAACPCAGSGENVVTDLAYGPGGLLKTLTARNPDTGDQVTRYEYGVTLGESDVASNALLRAEVYPDAADSSDRVTYSYNRQAQAKGMRDRNGTVHAYAFDGLGRSTADAVTVLAPGVDGTVLRIGRTYEIRGMVETVTSFSDAAGTSVVNQVRNGYNDFTQLALQYQEHAGAVNTGTSPRVGYGYADGSANTIRPTAMTYPNGRVLTINYAATAADMLSRLDSLTFDGTAVAGFYYLGLGSFVRTGYPQPGIQTTLATGTGANRYASLDRFGRVIDKRWDKAGTPLAELQYGYDRSSNRTYRKDVVATAAGQDLDELYRYDGLNQLRKFHRGLLVDGDTAIASPGLQQGWDFDATGNWKAFTQFDPADAGQTLDQQRVHNRANEITQIARTVGANWATPTYDRNGNTTGLPQAPAMTTLDKATWDAWNRLVKVEEPDGSGGWRNKAEYAYDGQTWRIVAKAYIGGTLTETRDLYYSAGWQVLEERGAGATQAQYVWNPQYIDALVLRDRSAGGSLNERLYAVQDANWNTVAVADAAGAVKERYGYTPFGVVQYMSAGWSPTTTSGYGWVVLFQGIIHDKKVELYQARMRWYSLKLGRWLSIDPRVFLNDEFNGYLGFANAPMTGFDPFGLNVCFESITLTTKGKSFLADNKMASDAFKQLGFKADEKGLRFAFQIDIKAKVENDKINNATVTQEVVSGAVLFGKDLKKSAVGVGIYTKGAPTNFENSTAEVDKIIKLFDRTDRVLKNNALDNETFVMLSKELTTDGDFHTGEKGFLNKDSTVQVRNIVITDTTMSWIDVPGYGAKKGDILNPQVYSAYSSHTLFRVTTVDKGGETDGKKIVAYFYVKENGDPDGTKWRHIAQSTGVFVGNPNVTFAATGTQVWKDKQ